MRHSGLLRLGQPRSAIMRIAGAATVQVRSNLMFLHGALQETVSRAIVVNGSGRGD